jgi:DDE family transposase
MVLRKTVCLKQLGGGRGGELGAGRFFANEKVTAEKIVESWSDRTVSAVAGLHVLAVQDTSEIKFATKARRRRGLGQCGHGNAYGVLVHVMMAVDADSGACLGLVSGKVWNRKSRVKTPLRKRALSDKESRRWVETAEQAGSVLAGAAMVTVVSDREGDIYPSWARLPGAGFHVLNRVMSDRRLAGAAEGETLYTAAAGFPLAGTRIIRLPARLPDRAARDAKVEIRFGEVEIVRPVNEKDRDLAETVRLRLVEVREIEVPEDVEPIHWRLLTTHDVGDVAKAWQIVAWYQARWTIEQLFRVMKSQGFGLEESQLHTAEGLVRLAAVATKAACIDMQLVQERDGKHGLAATVVFTEPEIETIEALNPTLEGKTERQQNPHSTGSLARACWVIARLGGWNCYGHPPGPITFHRGMERFNAMHQGRMLGLMMQ